MVEILLRHSGPILSVRCEDLMKLLVSNIGKSTQTLEIIHCQLPTETMSHLMQQINQCTALRVLVLSENSLNRCLSGFLPNYHLGLPELEKLRLTDTTLNKDDLQHLLFIAYKLHKLHILDLSNNILTGCLSNFLPDPHQGLPSLELLNLDSTSLNKEDLYHLSSIAHKLPKLQELDLSHNTLKGCLSSFLPNPYPGLPELKSLYLSKSKLNKDDLQHLTHLIQTHKLPGLKALDLFGNKLSEMETDVEHLIEVCVTHHQRELKLNIWGNSLSDAVEKKWKQRCEGTKIILLI